MILHKKIKYNLFFFVYLILEMFISFILFYIFKNSYFNFELKKIIVVSF
jgi:hypothetical protein